MSFTLKIKALILLIVLLAGVHSYFAFQKLKKENTLLRNNQEILLASNSETHSIIESYKVRDSLNAVKIRALLLTIDDYEQYRAADAKLIKELRLNKDNLQQVVSAQAKTINYFKTALRDTIILVDSTKTKARTFKYLSTWTDVLGAITNDSISLSITNREDLRVVETVKFKRFLGFLWKTNRIKRRDLSIISKNPNTSIVNVEYVHIIE